MQRGYTGFEVRGDVLWFNPSLPEHLGRIFARLRFRQHWVEIDISAERLKVSVSKDISEPIKVGYLEEIRELAPGEEVSFPL